MCNPWQANPAVSVCNLLEQPNGRSFLPMPLHRSHLSPATCFLQTHRPVVWSQSSRTDPYTLQLHATKYTHSHVLHTDQTNCLPTTERNFHQMENVVISYYEWQQVRKCTSTHHLQQRRSTILIWKLPSLPNWEGIPLAIRFVPRSSCCQLSFLFWIISLRSKTKTTTLAKKQEIADSQIFSVECSKICLQCFDAVGWGAGRASGL